MTSGVELLQKYFPGLTAKQVDQFSRLLPLYKEWNEKINVISRKDIEQLYERHVLHSLAIAKCVTFSAATRVVDAGTGGGFPGIPLAIYFPEVQFNLVDSIGKKVKVVSEISAAIGLKNIVTQQGRVEVLTETFDFAVSRAVAPLNEMIKWLKPLLRKGNNSTLPNGMIFLKGGDLADEMKATREKVQVTELSRFFEQEFFKEKKVLYVMNS